MKEGGGLHPAGPVWLAPNEAAPCNTGRADCRQRDKRVTPGQSAPVLAHVQSF